jgi:hypothetical protein
MIDWFVRWFHELSLNNSMIFLANLFLYVFLEVEFSIVIKIYKITAIVILCFASLQHFKFVKTGFVDSLVRENMS